MQTHATLLPSRIVGLTLALTTVFAFADMGVARDDARKLQGLWEIIRVEGSDIKARLLVGWQMHFSQGKVEFRKGDLKGPQYKFTINPMADPPEIDIINPTTDTVDKAIYLIEGSKLKIRYPTFGRGLRRPKSFNIKENPDESLLILERRQK